MCCSSVELPATIFKATRPLDQQGEGIELLYKGRRLHPARTEGCNEFELVGFPPERTRRKQRIRLVRTAGDQHGLDPGLLGATCEAAPALHVWLSSRRSAFVTTGTIRRCRLRRLHGDLTPLRQHPVESQIHPVLAASGRRNCRVAPSASLCQFVVSTVHGTAICGTACRSAHRCSAQGGVSTSRYPPSNCRVIGSAFASRAASGFSRYTSCFIQR